MRYHSNDMPILLPRLLRLMRNLALVGAGTLWLMAAGFEGLYRYNKRRRRLPPDDRQTELR